MKHFCFIAALACAGLMLTGCTEEKQSELSLKKVPYTTTVQGTIVYNQGTTMSGGRFVYNYVPAANLEVFLVVNNSEYDSNLQGQTVLTTTTDEKGNYTIEVPSGINGGTAIIKTRKFSGEMKSIERVNGEFVTKESTVIYSAQRNVNLSPNGVDIVNLTLSAYSVAAVPENCDKYAVLKGVIGKSVEVKTPYTPVRDDYGNLLYYNNATLDYCFEPAGGVDMIVKVNYSGYASDQNFNVTTNHNGEFELYIPVQQLPATYTYQLDILPVTDYTFTHYVENNKEYENVWGTTGTYRDYLAYPLKGWLEQTSWSTSSESFTAQVANDVKNIKVKGLVFMPYDNGQDLQGYYAGNFSSYSSWVSELNTNN